MEIFKVFYFDAAHFLPNVHKEHKCHNLHGHTYEIIIHVGGDVDEYSGWVIDFKDIKKAFTPILDELDHSYLNEIKGLENPTVENIAKWVWNKLEKKLPQLIKIVIYETKTSGCIYNGK